jgi:hypothetical protein
MATLTATAAASNVPAKYLHNGDIVRVVDYAFAASASAGDVIQMLRVPKGAIVTNVQAAMIDSPTVHGGVVTVNIGDGNDASAYGAGVVLSGSAVALTSIPSRGMGRSYSAEDTIDVTVAAVSAPGASGGVRLVVHYTLDN